MQSCVCGLSVSIALSHGSMLFLLVFVISCVNRLGSLVLANWCGTYVYFIHSSVQRETKLNGTQFMLNNNAVYHFMYTERKWPVLHQQNIFITHFSRAHNQLLAIFDSIRWGVGRAKPMRTRRDLAWLHHENKTKNRDLKQMWISFLVPNHSNKFIYIYIYLLTLLINSCHYLFFSSHSIWCVLYMYYCCDRAGIAKQRKKKNALNLHSRENRTHEKNL